MRYNKTMLYNKIVWKNIYYMLCYAIRYLGDLDLKDQSFDDIHDLNDLMGRLLLEAHRYSKSYDNLAEYNKERRVNSTPKGKLHILESIQSGKYNKGEIIHSVFNIDEDTYYNRIIKAAYSVLISKELKNMGEHQAEEVTYIRKELLHNLNDMKNISELSYESIEELLKLDMDRLLNDVEPWHRPVISVSIYILKNGLPSDSLVDNLSEIEGFNNYEKLNYIFEEFIREYLTEIFPIGLENRQVDFIGRYKIEDGIPDIIIHKCNRVTVIDAKWYNYNNNMKGNRDQVKLYAVNIERELSGTKFQGYGKVDAIVLYAMADWNSQIDKSEPFYQWGHNDDWFALGCMRALDLNKDFEEIKQFIRNIVEDYFFNDRLWIQYSDLVDKLNAEKENKGC